jgi:hypothetical protein
MSESEASARQERARERRARAVLRRVPAGDEQADPCPIRGAAAMSLAARLTRESWSLAGRPIPDYSRAQTPYRFVPRERK